MGTVLPQNRAYGSVHGSSHKLWSRFQFLGSLYPGSTGPSHFSFGRVGSLAFLPKLSEGAYVAFSFFERVDHCWPFPCLASHA